MMTNILFFLSVESRQLEGCLENFIDAKDTHNHQRCLLLSDKKNVQKTIENIDWINWNYF